MKKRMIILSMCLLFFTNTDIYANEEQISTTIIIEDEESPLIGNRNNNIVLYYLIFASVAVGGVAIAMNTQRNNLCISDVSDNGDGSYIVTLNNKNKEKMDVNVLKGTAIIMDDESDLVAILNENSEIECTVNDKKIIVNKEEINKFSNKKKS